MFRWIYSVFGAVMRAFNSLTGNYILALLLFALVVKLVFLPLAVWQRRRTVQMQNLRPAVEAIAQKYAGKTDQKALEARNAELTALKRRFVFARRLGFILMLVQLLILIPLYKIVRQPLTFICRFDTEQTSAIEGVLRANDLWYKNAETTSSELTQVDVLARMQEMLLRDPHAFDAIDPDTPDLLPDFSLFGRYNLAETPSIMHPSPLLIIPPLVALGQWLAVRIPRKLSGQTGAGQTEDERRSQLIMDLISPMVGFYFGFMLSAAVGLYWLFQSCFSILQSILLHRLMPIAPRKSQIRN